MKPKTASAQTLIQMTVDKEPDKIKAANALVDLAATNGTLREYLIQLGAKTAVGDRIRSDNAKIFNGGDHPGFGSAAQRSAIHEPPIVSLAHKRRITRLAPTLQLMSLRLPNGTIMAFAKRADVESAAQHHRTQASTMMHRYAFFQTVLQRLPDGKIVKDVFDESSLTAIYYSTEKEGAARAA